MPIKPKEVEHTFLVRTLEGWKPVREVPITEFENITECRLSETEPMSLAEENYSISIKLDGYGRLWAWFVDWQIMRDIPKISRK